MIGPVTILVFPFVCLGFMSLLNTRGHITIVPACSYDGTLSFALPNWNAMPQTQPTLSHYTDTGSSCHCAIH